MKIHHKQTQTQTHDRIDRHAVADPAEMDWVLQYQ
jgi:hypothetical protein